MKLRPLVSRATPRRARKQEVCLDVDDAVEWGVSLLGIEVEDLVRIAGPFSGSDQLIVTSPSLSATCLIESTPPVRESRAAWAGR